MEQSVSSDYARRCIEANKHNQVTTAYYLLLKKMVRTGKLKSEDEVGEEEEATKKTS